MKLNIALAPLAVLAVVAAGNAHAQTPAIQATVPFQFTVGTRLLPANDYTITASSPGVVLIESADKHFAARTTATPGNRQSPEGSELVFDKIGNQYFLHQVLCTGTKSMNVDIPASKREKAVEKEEAALGGVKQVLIAAR